MALLCSLLFPQSFGKYRHIYLLEGLSVSIPKSSVLIAALKDSAEEDYVIDLAEFDQMQALPTTTLEADETYIRPRLINIDEGLSLQKEEFILGKVKFIDPKKDSLIVSKEEAEKLIKAESTEIIASSEASTSDWYEVVKQEEKQSLIESLVSSSNRSNFNRLAALSYEDLQDLSYQEQEDPIINEIRSRINAAFEERDTSLKSDTITIVSHNQPSQSSGYSWAGKSKGKSKEDSGEGKEKQPQLRVPNDEKPFEIAGLYNQSHRSEEKLYSNSGFSFESLNVPSNKNEDPRDVRLSGAIEFTDGLAYLGPQSQLEVFHVAQNGKQTRADVNWDRAEYFADIVDGLHLLVAEYRDSAGQLLGYFETNIKSELSKLTKKLSLKPVSWGLRVDWLEATKDSIWNLWIDGKELIKMHGETFISEAWTSYSNFAVSIEADNMVSLNQIISAQETNKLKSYSEEYLKDLKEILYEQGKYLDPNLGIVIGEIKSKVNVAGFKAEITDPKAIGPIYFNDFFIPHVELDQSAHSGMFMFINVSPGNHQVRIRSNEVVSSNIGFVTQKSISKYNFDIDETKSLKLSAVDMETGLAQASIFQMPGADDLFRSESLEEVEFVYLKNKALNSLEYLAGPNYLPTRWSFSDRRSYRVAKKLPVVDKQLLSSRFDLEKPILHLDLSKKVSNLYINHLHLNTENLNLAAYRIGIGLEEFDPSQINMYDSVFVQGLGAGIHSVQFELYQGLMASSLVILSDGFVSYLEP
jgi:hypothetical protein